MIQMYIWSALLSNLNKCHKTQKKTTITDAENIIIIIQGRRGVIPQNTAVILIYTCDISQVNHHYIFEESFEEV